MNAIVCGHVVRQVAELKQELCDLQARSSEQHQSLLDATQEKDRRILALSQESEDAKAQNAACGRTIAELRGQVSWLEGEHTASRSKVAGLNQQVQRLEAAMRARPAAGELEQVQAEHAVCGRTIGDLRGQLTRLETEHLRCPSKVAALNKQVQQLEEKVQQLEAALRARPAQVRVDSGSPKGATQVAGRAEGERASGIVQFAENPVQGRDGMAGQVLVQSFKPVYEDVWVQVPGAAETG